MPSLFMAAAEFSVANKLLRSICRSQNILLPDVSELRMIFDVATGKTEIVNTFDA